jgi:hypothetical protein
MKADAGRARWDWEAMDSWSRLRASRDPARWPAVLEEIYQDVRRLPGGEKATRERVATLIQILFDAPPNDEEIAGLTLQEYLLPRL